MPNCRECSESTRARCIDECTTSSSVKMIMHRAFDAGTDTQDLWGLLQADCLIEQMERKSRTPRPSALRRRLKGEPRPAETIEAADEATRITPPPSPPELVAAHEPVRKPTPRQPQKSKKALATERYCLALKGDQHRIALPEQGELVLGRFDPVITVSPDVDLSHDDRKTQVISRRHARVTGRNGRHEIEDLGSTNGTQVNGKKLGIGQKVRLKSGDRVTLGYCEFTYTSLPEMEPRTVPPKAYFQVMFTGHRLFLPAWGKGIIGRSDNTLGFVPDIDLREEKEAAHVVARRHVRIIIRQGRHYVEDLGSTSGTRLNGVELKLGELGLLNPGDHLWLGGCVLAYDIEPD
ncbi:MAG: FHA domain-containing protein [Chloroflexi bacterium]|nr:FHA domain-containing protein [Chloroflexota bacterium]